jgi:uncharacterized protein YkwD
MQAADHPADPSATVRRACRGIYLSAHGRAAQRKPQFRRDIVLKRIRMSAAAALTAATVAAAPAAPAHAGTRKQMIRTINYVRSLKGRHRVAFSRRLSNAATAWARHLMQRSYLAHAAIPGGEGEIIEWHTGGNAAINSTVREWWNSPGHRSVMMARFRRAGAGRATGYFNGSRCTIWVVRFS